MPHSAAPCALSVRKQNIARHFARASNYDQHANVQQQVCRLLLASIEHQNQESVLEVGAGTGQMTHLLATTIKSNHWIINELSDKQSVVLQSVLLQAQIAIGDAETIDLDNNHSLIISANAVQWFDTPLNFIQQSYERLQSGGQLLFNTFTPNNFSQIKVLTGQGLEYPDLDAWQLALNNTGFAQIKLSTHIFNLQFSSPYDVLKHMKLTGVSTSQTQKSVKTKKAVKTHKADKNKQQTQPSPKPFIWTKARLQQFKTSYWQQFSGQDKNGQPCVNLTYEVLMINAVK